MRDVSTAFKQSEAKILPKAILTFADGNTLTLDSPKYFKLSGNSFSDSAGQSSFALGIAVAKTITLALWNDDDRYQDYDFYMCKIEIYAYRELDDGTTESILLGNFTATEPESYGTTVEITAIDDMYKFNVSYDTTLTFPVSLETLVHDSCETCGVTLLTTTFKNGDFEVLEKPENITHRQLIGYAAQIACGNARFDAYNRLEIQSYDFTIFDATDSLYGGIFDTDNPYSTGDAADGGAFNPWDIGYAADAGEFALMDSAYNLYYFKSDPVKSTDDVVITGVQISDEDTTYLYGESGYIISVDNVLASGQEQELVDLIGASIVGVKFRPFSAQHFSIITPEFMDRVVIFDRTGRSYLTFLTDIDFVFGSYTTLKCAADDPIRNSSTYASEATKAIIEARKNTKKQITEYDKAVQTLTSLITQSFGVYKTEEIQADGSIIYYMHNKSTLETSSTIWKMTADAFAVSIDGGSTWKAGFDSSGNAVVNVLSAIGINFNWAKGGTLKLGGASNGNGALYVYDVSGNQIGYWTKDGFYAKTGTFSGALSGASGTFSGTVSAGVINGSEINGSTINGSEFVTQRSSNTQAGVELSNGIISVYSNYPAATEASQIFGESRETIDENDEYVGGEVPMFILKSQWGINFDCGGVERAVEIVNWGNNSSSTDVHGIVRIPLALTDDFSVSGTKSRISETKNYGDRKLYCYETPTPYFGDIGSGILDENGICYVEIDDILSETVRTDMEYHVFLQKEGDGDLWVDEKEFTYFKIKGTPGLTFSWEIKIVQKAFEMLRLEEYGADLAISEENIIENYYEEEILSSDGIEEIYENEIELYETEMEELYI